MNRNMYSILICIFFLLIRTVSGFEIIWKLEFDEWAHMGIIHNGIAYNQWTGGSLTAVDLKTGQLLKSIDNVADATAPFIVGNKIYSFNGYNRIYEIDLDTFKITRQINISDANYTENIPYDPETGYCFVRRAVTSDYKGCLSAVRISDGQIIWTFPEAGMTGGFDGHQAPIVVGDSVYIFVCNAYWQYGNLFMRINKFNGTEIWRAQLNPSPSRGGYNNPIYDEDHDVFYVSESWNNESSNVYAIRRSDGQILWTHNFTTNRSIESTLSYHDNIVYVPLHNFDRQNGFYAALNSNDGSLIWETTGFFNEDGWSATAVCDKYLYRVTHGTGDRVIVQDRITGDLVWASTINAVACCTNPVQSEGIVVLGSERYLIGLKAGTGQAVDSGFHGKYATGFNPGAIEWGTTTPGITVISPNGGEIWTVGETRTVQWTSQGSVGNVNIDLSTDGGTNWTNLVSNTLNDGSQTVTVPNTPSSTCRIRVREPDGTPSDTSDNNFTISTTPPPPGITVIYPNGGETWTVGETRTVQWTSQGSVGNVNIDLSTDGGTNWTNLVSNAANDGSQTITVPNTPSSTCRIRVQEPDGSPSDISNSNFTIQSSGQTEPKISVSTTVLDFGTLDAGQTSTLTFDITNIGSGTLTGSITTDQEWIKVDPPSFNILSQIIQTINVTVDNSVLNQTQGQYTGTITIVSNGGTATVNVVVTATCVLVKPNPYNPNKGLLTFFGDGIVPGETTIKIYTLSGELVKQLRSGTGKEIVWDGKTDNGESVATGIYLYTYESPKEKGIGKFTVIYGIHRQ